MDRTSSDTRDLPESASSKLDVPGLASICSFAVPTGAVLESRAEGDWRIEVLPLRQVSDAPDVLEGPGVDHVHVFDRSVQGAHTAVLLYTGPRARLKTSYTGKGAFTVNRLTTGFAPVSADNGEPLELLPWTLLQVSNTGAGRWVIGRT